MVQYLYVVGNPLRWVDLLGLELASLPIPPSVVHDAPALPWGTELVAKQSNLKLYESYSPSSRVLNTIPNGSSVSSQNEAKTNANTTWYKVAYKGQVGWVDAKYFQEKKSNGTLTQNAAGQNQGRVPNTDPAPEPSQPKDFNPNYPLNDIGMQGNTPSTSSPGENQSNNPPEGLRLVGFGLQLEFSGIAVQQISGGFEVVIYIDEYVVKNNNKWYTSSLYFYVGGTISGDDLLTMVQNLASNVSVKSPGVLRKDTECEKIQ